MPKALYHWRCHKDSTASNPESKLYAFDAGARAIMDHYKRVGIEAERVEKGVDYGIYHSVYKIQGEPLVSIIIRIRITIRIWIYACGRLRRGQRTAMLSLSL